MRRGSGTAYMLSDLLQAFENHVWIMFAAVQSVVVMFCRGMVQQLEKKVCGMMIDGYHYVLYASCE